MTLTESLLAAAPLPTELLGLVSARRREADAAEIDVLELATHWADAHPADRTGAGDAAVADDQKWVVSQPVLAREVTDADRAALSEYHPSLLDLDGELGAADEDTFTWAAIPAMAWDAPAAFAAANGMSTTAGKALIRDALVLRHRLPRTWAQVLVGRVPAWRARRIAQVVLAAPADVVEDIDARLAPVAGTIGPVALAHLLDASMLRLHAELRELEQVAALDRRSVVLDEQGMNHTGIADLVIHSDWSDLKDLEATIDRLADALTSPAVAELVASRLGARPDDLVRESRQVRRALAAGLLADPAQALDVMRLLSEADDDTEPAAEVVPALADRGEPIRRQVNLTVHLTDLSLAGLGPVARVEGLGATLLETVRGWCARTDTAVRVRPVIDLPDLAAHVDCFERDVYDITDRLREAVGYLHPTCVFPHCERPAMSCDHDHADPWPDGPTCVHNLAPLCRHHHRLKTHTAWSYEVVDPLAGCYRWTSPHGIELLVDHRGTHRLPDII